VPVEKAGSGGPVRRTWLRIGVCLAAVVYVASGIYTVAPDQYAVVRRFGRVLHHVGAEGKLVPRLISPGLHYHLPWPVERVDRVKALETKTVTVGFEAPDVTLAGGSSPREVEFLTGDENIMRLQMTVQYTVSDPVAYLLNAADTDNLLKQETASALTAVVAEMGVDDLIGPARAAIGPRVLARLRREEIYHEMGVDVRSANLQTPLPPQEVAEAFNRVQSAKAEMHRLQLKAEGYRLEQVTKAQGEADKMLREAEAYARKRTEGAHGEARRFEEMYEAYKKSKELTSLRLYVEAMEMILPRLRKLIVASDETGEPVDIGIVNTER